MPLTKTDASWPCSVKEATTDAVMGVQESMTVLGIITCEILELGFARLLARTANR